MKTRFLAKKVIMAKNTRAGWIIMRRKQKVWHKNKCEVHVLCLEESMDISLSQIGRKWCKWLVKKLATSTLVDSFNGEEFYFSRNHVASLATLRCNIQK